MTADAPQRRMTPAELETELREHREATLIVNTRSRRGKALFRAARKGLAERGVRVAGAHAVRTNRELLDFVRKAVEAGSRLIVVGGGDGTLSSVSGEFAYRDVVLGVLPLGTGNSFARTLKIAPRLEPALDVIAGGHVATVDLGRVNGRYFSNVATIGLSADVARKTPSRWKSLFGPLSYLFMGVGVTIRHRAFAASITVEENTERVATHQIIIANGRFFGVTPILSGAQADNGCLALITLLGRSRWSVAKLWLSLFTHRVEQLSDAEGRYVQACRIMTLSPKRIDIDGEAIIETPAEFSVAAGALHVLVPPAFHDAA